MIPEAPKVGDALPSLDKAMTQDIIDAWADVSGDRNPLHVDPEYARTTRYGGTIAHGHIALSYLSQLMQGWAGPDWMRGGRLVDIKFISPIRPGRTYRIGGEIAAISDQDLGVKLHIRDSSDGRDCIEGTAVCPRRSH
ncbi:3-hydroxybutyryl-CoA dehydratase [uncultured bacterium]|nr:3-hydroxybutyryl-CoA dehydratase [uncultured bacterium]